MQFFQQYFDVDTDDVLSRVTHAITRPHAGSFATLHGDNPDLYGPFWICATLIFLNSMGGQYAVYLSRRRAPQTANSTGVSTWARSPRPPRSSTATCSSSH